MNRLLLKKNIYRNNVPGDFNASTEFLFNYMNARPIIEQLERSNLDTEIDFFVDEVKILGITIPSEDSESKED